AHTRRARGRPRARGEPGARRAQNRVPDLRGNAGDESSPGRRCGHGNGNGNGKTGGLKGGGATGGTMAPGAGFEPPPTRLTADCSTAELPRNRTETLPSQTRPGGES